MNSGDAYSLFQPHRQADGSQYHFPVRLMLDLEDRVFATSWSIPLQLHEPLGLCLKAAAKVWMLIAIDFLARHLLSHFLDVYLFNFWYRFLIF